MNSVVYIPFAASVVVAALSRLATRRLWPRTAVWVIVVASAALALSTVGALVVLASPLPARLPLMAHAGRWQPDAVAAHSPIPSWISTAALALLAVLACRLGRELRRLSGEARDAARLSAAVAGPAHGEEVVVLDDDVPRAHALGVGLGRRGAIIISSAMLALLDDDERAAVLAHEQTHLRQRHSLFLGAIRLAAALDPLLATTRSDVRFALERCADEAAATASSRPVVASALAKAALGVLHRGSRLAPGFGFHPHRVTDRVDAMLDPPSRSSRPAWAVVAVAVGAVIAVAWATHDTERFFESARLWSRA